MAEIRRNPYLLKLEDKVVQLQSAKAAKRQITDAQNKVRSHRTSLTQKTLKKYKVDWAQQRRDWKIATRGKQRPDNDAKTDLLKILSQIMPERGRLARMMSLRQVISVEERRQVIEDLCSLANRDCTTIYLPGESPIDGVCPVQGCDMKMER